MSRKTKKILSRFLSAFFSLVLIAQTITTIASNNPPTITNTTALEFSLIGPEGYTPGSATISVGALDNNGVPYMTFREVDTSERGISVMRFNGTDWEFVGDRNFSPGQGNPYNIVFDSQNRPYVAYRSFSPTRFSVNRFNGTDWELINNGIPSGDPVGGELAVDSNGDIWAGYGRSSVHVRKFNQLTDTWEQIGNTGFNTGGANNTTFTVADDGTPYIAWADVNNGNRITVYTHNDTTDLWELVGTPGLSDDSTGGDTKLTTDSNNNPYILYKKFSNSGGERANVQTYNGSNWQYVGTNPISNSATSGTWITRDSQDNFYISYRDFSNGSKIGVHKFDGARWDKIDGDNLSSGGILYSSTAIDNNNDLHVFYQDQSIGYRAVAKKSSQLPIRFTVNENAIQAGLITGIEPDGENVTYNLSGTDASLFSTTNANLSDALINIINPLDYENPLDENGDNIYEFEITITDELTPQFSQTKSVEIEIIDTAEFTVNPSLQEINEGESRPIEITLNQEPTGNVEIRLFPFSSSDLTVDIPSIFFTPSNWDQPQTVNITAVNDNIDSDRTSFININTYNPNSASEYQNISTIRANVNIVDDEESNIIINPIDTETSEDGDTAEIEFSLDTLPKSRDGIVNIKFELDDLTEGDLNGVSELDLTFGSTSTLQITGLDDDEYDPNNQYNLVITDVASSDEDYNSIDTNQIPNITITNIDDNDPIDENIDSDNDGVLNGEELNTPNNGDGNNDGILDLLQPNVITIENPTGDLDESVTLVVEISCPGTDAPEIFTENQFSDDPNYEYPYGLLKFTINCTTSIIESFWYGIDPNQEYIPRKYGPTTPGDLSTTQWYNLDNTTTEKITIDNLSVLKINYNLSDGELGDDTGVDGQIIDPIGLAVLDATETVEESTDSLIRTGGY